MANKFRKIINKVGLDLHRYRPEANRLAWLQHLNISTVFDIGANVGQFAKEIRNELPEAQIYSFEPIKECYGQLVTVFAKDLKFRAFNVALGETTGFMDMNRSSYTPSSSLLHMADSHKELFPHTKGNTVEQIKIEKLDDVFDRLNPVQKILIKVDTQGYEDKVIAGGLKAFRAAHVIIIETSFIALYKNQPLFDEIYEKLKSFGFTYRGALHQKINNKTGEVIFEDALFVRG